MAGSGGIRSNVKKYTLKRLTSSQPRLSGADTTNNFNYQPQHLSSWPPETSMASYRPSRTGDCKSTCLPTLSSASKDLMDVSSTFANNGKETSNSVLSKRKFEKSGLEDLTEKIEYVNGFAPAYRDQTPNDILLHSGDYEPPIPAHKLLLATRSKILNHIPNSYGSKAPSDQMDTVSLPELNHEELDSLVDFLYNADLPEEKMNKHVYSLYAAASIYGIPYLDKFCVRHMLKSLSSTNALDVLEFADANSCQTLKYNVMDYIAKNMNVIALSARFVALELKNPSLYLQISKASMKELVKMQNAAAFRQRDV